MRKSFTAGLVILLPIFLTVMIVVFLINLLTQPFLVQTEALITRLGIFQISVNPDERAALIALTSKVIILLMLVACILFTGFAGKHFILDHLFRIGNRCLDRIPVINKIFKTSQDVVHSLFSSTARTFSQVVCLPFPQKGKLSIGFVTCDIVKIVHRDKENQELVSVFIPGTPNPTAGCLLLVKKDQLIFVDMKVDEAMRFIVSCGIPQPLAGHDS